MRKLNAFKKMYDRTPVFIYFGGQAIEVHIKTIVETTEYTPDRQVSTRYSIRCKALPTTEDGPTIPVPVEDVYASKAEAAHSVQKAAYRKLHGDPRKAFHI